MLHPEFRLREAESSRRGKNEHLEAHERDRLTDQFSLGKALQKLDKCVAWRYFTGLPTPPLVFGVCDSRAMHNFFFFGIICKLAMPGVARFAPFVAL